MENQKGNVETISKQNNAVQIDGIWYDLGPKVKLQYLKKGACEYSTEVTEPDSNDLVVFCRSAGASQSPSSNGTIQNPGLENSDMTKMAALKFAGNVYMGTGQEDEAKRLTEEVIEYLQKGIWISKER